MPTTGPLRRILLAVTGFFRAFFLTLFGEISWRPPSWLAWIGRSARSHPVRALTIFALAIALTYGARQGWIWFKHRPKPRTVSVRVDAPGVTPIKKIEKREWPTLELRFGGVVAPIENVGKEISSGVRLTPSLPGNWQWR